MFNKVKSMLKMSRKDVTQTPMPSEPYAFYHNYKSGSSNFVFEKGHAYDNTYGSVKTIANAFLAIRPYAIDANGKPLNQCRLVDVLARPNSRMSGADFREALATMLLTHKSVALLAYHQEGNTAVEGGDITKDNIAGFNFLENYYIQVIDGKKYYKDYERKTVWSEDEVIELFAGYDPYDIYSGYSPTQAVKKWANVDDYLAAYEAGLIENNGVPSGQFIITAPTTEDFNNIVDKMESKHRGGGRNNAPMYVHRPVGTDGNALTEQVEWIPFSQKNSELALEPLFNQANDKIDSAFGVPASIRGVSKENSWASVRSDERIFVTYTVVPFATKVWNRFTTEMNRITGGLGYALTFDIDIPGIAEEEKIDAERKNAELDLIIKAKDAGFTLDSIIDAFDLSTAYKTLENGSSDETDIENDKPEVDEGGEVENAPETESEKSSDPKGHSQGCTCHTLATKDSKDTDKKRRTELEDVLRKAMLDQIEAIIKENNGRPQTATDELSELDINADGVIDAQDAEEIRESLYMIPSEPTEEQTNNLTKAMLAVIIAIMIARGMKEQEVVIKLIHDKGLEVPDTPNYSPDNVERTTYGSYLTRLARDFLTENDNRAKQSALQTIIEAGQDGRVPTRREIAENIRKRVADDEWRIQRIARTEEHRANQLSQIDAIEKLQAMTSAKIYKIWHRNPTSNSCEFCIHMDGTKEPVSTPFIRQGETVIGEDGGIFQNTYQNIEGAYAHPNCACYLTFEVEQ